MRYFAEVSHGVSAHVKGYGVDRAKIIMRFVDLNAEDSNDGRVDSCVSAKVELKKNRQHPICGGNTLNNRTSFIKISSGTRLLRVILGRVEEDGSWS